MRPGQQPSRRVAQYGPAISGPYSIKRFARRRASVPEQIDSTIKQTAQILKTFDKIFDILNCIILPSIQVRKRFIVQYLPQQAFQYV